MSTIDELLNRGVEKVYPSKESLQQVLNTGKKLRLYQGFDPTGDKLHIGHMVGLRKHREWQDLDHEVIFLIGDGTGQAGDPTGKNKTRDRFFTQEELRANAKDYLNQASKIVRFDGPNPVKILYNGDWLNKLTLVDILNIAQHFSVQQLIERDMFQERIKNSSSINLREFLYPILQGYDSVALDVDLELGGSDQTFNMLCGRSLMKSMKQKDKFIMTTPILSDSKGVKIGKSEGNVIGLTDAPDELFGKIMSLGDDSIIPMFTLLTNVSEEEIKNFNLKKDAMALKKRVARLVITQLRSEEDADEAEENFSNTFQKREIPENIEAIDAGNRRPIDVLIASGIVSSVSAGRRLLDAGAVTDMNTNEKISINDALKTGHVYRVGKHRFLKTK